MMHFKYLVAAIGMVTTAALAVQVTANPLASADVEPPVSIYVACELSNNLYKALVAGGSQVARFESGEEAIEAATQGSCVMLLADGYPDHRTEIKPEQFAKIKFKELKSFLEYPAEVPGLTFEAARTARWERGVIATDGMQLGLPKLAILALHDCQYLPTKAHDPLFILGRVAGFDHAVYGLPNESFPILFRTADGMWVSTTKLSDFVDSRYAPSSDWVKLWESFLLALDPEGGPRKLAVTPLVAPAFHADDELAVIAESESLGKFAAWCLQSRLLIATNREPQLRTMMLDNLEVAPAPEAGGPAGDGTYGILEGYASQILPDGSQLQRIPIRADCQAETAAVLALNAKINDDPGCGKIASNLLNYLYYTSDLCRHERGDPGHPAFGLISWGAVSPAWRIANYGDDNARTLLATIAAASTLESGEWDKPILCALYANLRTTGKLGFRGDNINIAQLEASGWKHFHDAETINVSPHFEAYAWACYLWAYSRTHDEDFLASAKLGIRRTMESYPTGWRWGENLDRARMLMALAWLVRVEDTAEHRRWLKLVATDLIATQQPCGGIPEQPGNASTGHFLVPTSNEAYGTGETPLIQESGDPVTDQLYVSGFVLLGLRESVAATDDPDLKAAEDKLADYLVRIQVKSNAIPYLDGTWFRAFDYRRWDYWSSSGDMGWGAWCAETGWGPAWTAITFGLRANGTSLWDLSKNSKIGDQADAVRMEMSRNTGEPLSSITSQP